MNNTNIHNEYKQARKLIIIVLIVFIAFTTLYLIALPVEAKAFNMDELEILIKDSKTIAGEATAIEANTDVNSDDFVADTAAYGNQIKAIAEKINSKRPEIEGVANDINASNSRYVVVAEKAGFLKAGTLNPL